LKNPLGAILTLPEVIAESGNLDADQLEMLRIIEESALRMLDMINLSLDLFKMEQGIYDFQPEPVNVVSVCERIRSEMRSLSRSLEQEIAIHAENGELQVLGEELLCYSMLANLVKNAMEASPRGSAITVRLQAFEDRAEVSVHNPAPVPPEVRDRFFEKYATAGKKGGTGLGAYSARLIAETHGGEIGFTTCEQAGTTVFVRLPRRQVEE